MAVELMVPDFRYPLYNARFVNWAKWRLTYTGGDLFIKEYLEKFSKRETEEDFARRKKVTYLPAFAKAAIEEIKNSIFQRMEDIRRVGGSDSYTAAMQGKDGGVDNESTSMNTFIGQSVLPELLSMSIVGIYTDMPSAVGAVYGDNSAHPYIYTYRVEDILNYTFRNANNQKEFQSLVLRDYYYLLDSSTQLPTGEVGQRTRHMWINPDGFVNVQMWKDGSQQQITTLKIRKIPFVMGEISDSLLADVANYQIALLNVASSDLAYVLLANFPFYTEQDDGVNLPSHLSNEEGSAAEPREIKVGTTVGRSYKKGMDRPGFVHPSSEPMTASMQKQEQMKSEIRQLVQLAVANLQPKMASAESKSFDSRGLEAGLSYIGLELQRIENKIAEFWAAYENEESGEVKYPSKYMLKTDQERLEEVGALSKQIVNTPSLQYKKEISKRIARVMLTDQVPMDIMTQIETEIQEATAFVNDPVMMQTLLQNGAISTVSAASSQALPKNDTAIAATEHAARIARIQAAQTPGNGQVNGVKSAEKKEQGASDTSSSTGTEMENQGP